ncbi:MAG: hypothetical protein ACFB20_00645 [Opitutales bacterium]
MSEALAAPRPRRGSSNTALTLLLGLPVFAAVTFGTLWLLRSTDDANETSAPDPRVESVPPIAQEPPPSTLSTQAQPADPPPTPAAVAPVLVDRSEEVFAPIESLPVIERDPATAPAYSDIVADQRLWPEVLALVEPHTIPIRSVGREVGRITLESGTVLQIVKILPHGYMMVRAENNQFVVPVFKTNLDFVPDPAVDAAHEETGAAIQRGSLQDHVAVLLADPDAPNADELRERLARDAVLEHVTQLTRDWARNALGLSRLEIDGGLLTARMRAQVYEDSPDLTFAARQIARHFVQEAQSWGADLNFILCKVESLDGTSTVAVGSFRGAYVEAAQTP